MYRVRRDLLYSFHNLFTRLACNKIISFVSRKNAANSDIAKSLAALNTLIILIGRRYFQISNAVGTDTLGPYFFPKKESFPLHPTKGQRQRKHFPENYQKNDFSSPVSQLKYRSPHAGTLGKQGSSLVEILLSMNLTCLITLKKAVGKEKLAAGPL
jgi:hypothetical protein